MQNHKINRQRNKDLEADTLPLRYGFNYALWVYEPIDYDQSPVSHNLSVQGGKNFGDVRQGQE